MTLALTDDQAMIREVATSLFAEQSGLERARAAATAGRGHDDALWRMAAVDLGWTALPVPDRFCGLALGPIETVIILEAAGRDLAPLPLWSVIGAAVPLLVEVATEQACGELLPQIAAGERIVAVAWPHEGVTERVTARRGRDGYLLSGRTGPVVDLGVADTVLVRAVLDGRLCLFSLHRGQGVQVRPLQTLDGTRSAAELELDDLPAGPSARIDKDDASGDAWSRAWGVAQLTLAAEQVGAARGAMDMTLAYIAERVQFGRTIASFQAIKHRCARLEVDFAEARALVYGAAARARADFDPDWLAEALGARALATEVLFRAAEECIQLHGGVGFTLDYDAHLYLKRAQASATWLGRADEHLARIADRLLGPEQGR